MMTCMMTSFTRYASAFEKEKVTGSILMKATHQLYRLCTTGVANPILKHLIPGAELHYFYFYISPPPSDHPQLLHFYIAAFFGLAFQPFGPVLAIFDLGQKLEVRSFTAVLPISSLVFKKKRQK